MAYPHNEDGTVNVHLTEEQVELTSFGLQRLKAEMFERCKPCRDARYRTFGARPCCDNHERELKALDAVLHELNEAGT